MENKIDKSKIAFNMFSRLSEDIRDYIALYESCGGADFSSVMKLASYIKKTTERIIIDTTGTEDVASGQGKDDTDDTEAYVEPLVCGYRMVDLGLPSGLKWSDRNVGAATPEAFGDYFMWGSTEPDTDKPCDWTHAPFNNGREGFDKEYFSNHKSEWLMENRTLKPEYDAAHAIMGEGWRMPTAGEMHELIDGTTQSVEMLNGVKGVRFTSKANGNSIFIPFAGYRYGSDINYAGSGGYAWSSSLDAISASCSHHLGLDDDGEVRAEYGNHYFGFAVRGVHNNLKIRMAKYGK